MQDKSMDANMDLNQGPNQEDREVISQVSLLQSLTLGNYQGSVTAGQLRQKGDIGIGTFDGLNGELIMLEGVIYRAAGDGSIEVVPDEETIPFADVTFFDSDKTQEIAQVADIGSLKEALDREVAGLGPNRFYMVRIDGKFSEMHVRSERAQQAPYRPLAQVMETDQTLFDYKDVSGTVVGLYCPRYMDHLNAVGWHFHFISDDRTKGGHVLGMAVEQAKVLWDVTPAFGMILPEDPMFEGSDLTADQSEDIRKVESGE